MDLLRTAVRLLGEVLVVAVEADDLLSPVVVGGVLADGPAVLDVCEAVGARPVGRPREELEGGLGGRPVAGPPQ